MSLKKIRRWIAKHFRKFIKILEKFKLTPELVATIYTLNIMVGFQLFMSNLYYNIQDAKLYYFLYSTMAALGVLILIQIVRWTGTKLAKIKQKDTNAGSVATNIGDDSDVTTIPDMIVGQDVTAADVAAATNVTKPTTMFASALTKKMGKVPNYSPKQDISAFASDHRSTRKVAIRRLWDFFFRLFKMLTLPEKFALGFITVVIISTCCSRYAYEAFWGNMGRYQGCYTLFFYVAGFFIMSRLYHPKKWHVDVFLFVALLTSVWSIMDFYWMSPVNWQNISGGDSVFRSAFGNIDSVTAYHGIVLALSSTLFVLHREKRRKKDVLRTVYYGLVLAVTFMAMMTEGSDNGILSVGAIACFLPFLAFGTCRGIVRYLLMLALWLVTPFATNLGLSLAAQHLPDDGFIYALLVDNLNLSGILFVACVSVAVILIIIFRVFKEKIDERKLARVLRIIWFTLGVLAFTLVIFIYYDANTGGHEDLYAPYSNLLIFNEAWGSGRGYIWSLGWRYFINYYSPLQMLVGTGPETFYIATLEYSYLEIIGRGNLMYDSLHSEVLQYLFSTGILGFICYYGWMGTAVMKGVKAGVNKAYPLAAYAAGFAFAVLAHIFASSVNISTPTVFPLTVLVIGVAVAASRDIGKS